MLMGQSCHMYPQVEMNVKWIIGPNESLVQNESLVHITIAYFISLPKEHVHHGHPTVGGIAGFSQRVNEKVVVEKLQMVSETFHRCGSSSTLHPEWFMQGNPPDPNDRAYFPLDSDLKNHIYMARCALQLSSLHRKNAVLNIEQWKKADPHIQQ